jgi:hypothetical protein
MVNFNFCEAFVDIFSRFVVWFDVVYIFVGQALLIMFVVSRQRASRTHWTPERATGKHTQGQRNCKDRKDRREIRCWVWSDDQQRQRHSKA